MVFYRSFASMYYTERKLKNENGGGLGTRLGSSYLTRTHHSMRSKSRVHGKLSHNFNVALMILRVQTKKWDCTLFLNVLVTPYSIAERKTRHCLCSVG